jgi:CBS domain-containing protein
MNSPSKTLIESTVADLRRHSPFDAMEPAHLVALAASIELGYHAAGDTVLAPSTTPVTHLFIVQKGEIAGKSADADAEGGLRLVLSEGECFPVGAMISRRPVTLRFVAVKDSFVYRLPMAAFEQAMDVSRPFRDFATRRLAALLDQSQRLLQGQYSSRLADTRNLTRPLKSVLRRAPVTVDASAPLLEVLTTMKSLRIGSVVVIDAAERPMGIFTERDVLNRVALAGTPLDTPVERVMTQKPFSLPAHADVLEAAQAMARFRFRHVLVMEEGKLAGVVSERDLFSLQRLSVGDVAKSIELAQDAEALAHAAGSVRALAGSLLAQGVAAAQLTHLVTILNDAILKRALTFAGFDFSREDWCWIGLGSEGRMEQTLATDQDNALVFVSAGETDLAVVRESWLDRAQRANAILDQCGFPRCKGDIMASNPRWCMTAEEWRATFLGWMQGGNGEALLNAAIFFDFRTLAGNARLAGELRTWLNEAAPRHPLFLRQMAVNALQVRPPLGLIRDFVVDDERFPGTIDLKQLGARPFIDAARVYALKEGVDATNTAERIRALAPILRMSADESESLCGAFHFIQMLRLRQQEGRNGEAGLPPNRLDPDELNELDRRILKEALRQARKLQSRLEMDFTA